MAQSNRNIKDSLFVDLFSNGQAGKKNFLSLYNALHGTNLKFEDTVIENRTIPQSMYKTFHNDVSMLIDNKLIVMIEHQSTVNENMPFRLLEYVTRIYEGIVPTKDRYLKKRISIPTPEFYVFYNGLESYPDEKILRLSDSFVMSNMKHEFFPQLELTVRVINIGPCQTLQFQNGCAILKEYCDFIELVRQYVEPGDPESYKNAISEAIKQGILTEYLKANATEVINMFLAEYDYETDIAVQREEAREEGREEGRSEGRVETARRMLSEGLSRELISKCTGLSAEELNALGMETV